MNTNSNPNESYYKLLLSHLPLPLGTLRDKFIQPKELFGEIKKIEDNGEIKCDMLKLDSNFDFEVLLSYVLYRLWCAYKRFPDLKPIIEDIVLKNFPAINLSMNFNINPGISNPIGLSNLLHASRGLIEADKKIVSRATVNCINSFYLKELEPVPETSKELYEKLQNLKERITKTSLFKNAIMEYFNVLEVAKSPEEINMIIENCENAKIRVVNPANASDIGGIVTPDGFGINLESITESIKDDEISLARCVAIVCHELAHFAIRIKEFSVLEFANNTPSKVYKVNGRTYEDLEGGYLFSLIMLGTYQKNIWTIDKTRLKLLNPETWPEKPALFSQDELNDLEDEPLVNAYKSGVISIYQKKQLFM